MIFNTIFVMANILSSSDSAPSKSHLRREETENKIYLNVINFYIRLEEKSLDTTEILLVFVCQVRSHFISEIDNRPVAAFSETQRSVSVRWASTLFARVPHWTLFSAS
jgi:hypothetical protein